MTRPPSRNRPEALEGLRHHCVHKGCWDIEGHQVLRLPSRAWRVTAPTGVKLPVFGTFEAAVDAVRERVYPTS